MARPPLDRYPGLHDEPGVPRDEMLLCDVVESYEARGFRPSPRRRTFVETGNCACPVAALAGPEKMPGAMALASDGLWSVDVSPSSLVVGYDCDEGVVPDAEVTDEMTAAYAVEPAMSPIPTIEITAELLESLNACDAWLGAMRPMLPIHLSADVGHVRSAVRLVGQRINADAGLRARLFGHVDGPPCSATCSACSLKRGTADPLGVVPASWLAARLAGRAGRNVNYNDDGSYRWEGVDEGELGVRRLALAVEYTLAAEAGR
jgi:hypothetical protein